MNSTYMAVQTHLTPSYRFVLNTRCYSCVSHRGTSSRLSETPSLLDFRHTLGNDSVLQCVLHQYLNGSYWYSVFEIGCSSNSIYHCLCIQRSLIKSVVLPDPPSMLYSMSFKTSWHRISHLIRLLWAVPAIRRLQEPFPRLVGRRFPSLFRASFWDTVGGGVPTVRGIGRHPSMPSAWIGFMISNLLTSTVSSFTDVTVKSNRTGNIPRRLRGIGFHLSMCLNPDRTLSHPDFICQHYTDTQICNALPFQ